MKPLRHLCWLPVLLLAACASLPQGPGCVAVGPHGAACLLPPAALPATDANHLVSVRHDGRTRHFVGRLHVDDKVLELAASSLLGMPLFTIRFDGKSVHASPERKELPADLVAVVLEAALADPARLRPRLTGLRLAVHDTGSGQTRTLTERGRTVARIERSDGPLAQARLVIHIDPVDTVLTLTPLQATP